MFASDMLSRIPIPSLRKRKAGETLAAASSATSLQAEQIAQLITVLADADAEPNSVVVAVTELRKILAIHRSPPIQEVLNAGALPPLLATLTSEATSPLARFEVAWVLTNIASGCALHTRGLIEGGAVEALLMVLESSHIADEPELCDQCLWALGNIAGDGDVAVRDRLLSEGVIGILGMLFGQMPEYHWDTQNRMNVLRTMTWLMSSLCRGSPAPALELVDCCFDFFVQVLLYTEDAQMSSDALWGLCYLLEGSCSDDDGSRRAERLLSTGFASKDEIPSEHPLLARVVLHSRRVGDRRNPLHSPALRLLSTLVSLPSAHVTSAVLAADALPVFCAVVSDSQFPEQGRKDAASALANISAGTPAQAQHLVQDPVLWQVLGDRIQMPTSGEFGLQIRRECSWTVANTAKLCLSSECGAPEPKEFLSLISKSLRSEMDPALQRALLDAGEAVLQHGHKCAKMKQQAENPLLQPAEQNGFLDELEDLQRSSEESVRFKARYLIETWFSKDTENVPPIIQENKVSIGMVPSAICGKTPKRRAAYQFGA